MGRWTAGNGTGGLDLGGNPDYLDDYDEDSGSSKCLPYSPRLSIFIALSTFLSLHLIFVLSPQGL